MRYIFFFQYIFQYVGFLLVCSSCCCFYFRKLKCLAVLLVRLTGIMLGLAGVVGYCGRKE